MDVATAFSKSLGQKIREMRESAGIGLRELARTADISHSSLSEFEAGISEPSASKIQRIATALKTKVDKLLPQQ